MAVPVILRDGKDKIFRSEGQIVLNADERAQAEENDRMIEEKMRDIEEEMENTKPETDKKKNNLLELVNQKRGVVELWWNVGTRLKPFIDEFEISIENKKWLYRAAFDHAGRMDPTRDKPAERNLNRPESSHFSYCCMIAQFPWNFAKSTIWTNWCHFFDLQSTKNDHRIIEWLHTKQSDENIQGEMHWLRSFAKGITEAFRNKDTGVLSDDELNERLERIYNEATQTEDSVQDN